MAPLLDPCTPVLFQSLEGLVQKVNRTPPKGLNPTNNDVLLRDMERADSS
jgi:hypothetical protein